MSGLDRIGKPLGDIGGADIDAAPVACLSSASFWTPERLTNSAWFEHAPFAFWLTTTARPELLVELGTHHGFSYFAFCQAVRRAQLPTACHAIDTWEGDEHTGFYGNEVFDAVNRYNERQYSGFSRLVRSTFDAALERFTPASIDLLHIDGRHRYEDVAHDFARWHPKLSDRAIVLFHDIDVREREFGVWRLWHEISGRYSSFAFTHGHGLGVLGIGADISDAVRALFEADEPAQNVIRQAYARLGHGVRMQFERYVLAEEIKKRDRLLTEARADVVQHRPAAQDAEARSTTSRGCHVATIAVEDRRPTEEKTTPQMAVSGSFGSHLPRHAGRLLRGAARMAYRALMPARMAEIRRRQAIRLVCATRHPTAEDFYNKTALGRSLRWCYADLPSLGLQLFPGNKDGLPSVYNRAVDSATHPDELLVFLHDDLHLIDLFWADELRRAVEHFDVVGLAGNRRRAARQPSWVFVDEHMTFDQPENLSGRIGHGNGFPSPVSDYGPTPRKCLLLDGLLLAVRSNTLHKHGLRFNERFRFHFYDMDFCRQADQSGLSMGTWPIGVVHESGGSVGSENWRAEMAAYFEKWGE
jgi:methyltransferase family protein